jgi:hypothetical protein
MKRLVLIAALMSIVVGLIAVPASAQSLKHCGSSVGVRNVNCQTGHKVLDAFDGRCRGNRSNTCRVFAFTCLLSSRAGTVRCIAGNREIVVRLRPGSLGPNGRIDCELRLQNDTGTVIEKGVEEPSAIDGHGVTSFVRHASPWGCSITYFFELTETGGPLAPLQGRAAIRVRNPLIGSSTYSCHASGDFRCFGPQDGSDLLGYSLQLIYYVCVPGADVKVLGRHLPGYCGTP